MPASKVYQLTNTSNFTRMNETLTRARGRPVAAAIAGTVAIALLGAAPLAFAQNASATDSQPTSTATTTQTPGFFQSVFTLPASGTNASGASLSQQITCAVFGILDSFGILHAQAGCTPTSTFPFPGFPFPGNGNNGNSGNGNGNNGNGNNGSGNGNGNGNNGGHHGSAGTLSVKKVVTGTTTPASSFTLKVSGGHASPGSFAASATGTDVSIDRGSSYSVREAATDSYKASYSSGCSGTMPWNGTRSCVVTNTWTGTTTATTTTPMGSIRVIKKTDNTDASSTDATSSPSDFMLSLKTASSSDASSTDVVGSPHAGSSSGILYTDLPFGSYWLSETGSTTGSYTPTFSGDCDSGGMITLSATATSSTCTLTNTWNGSSTAPTTTPTLGSLEIFKMVDNAGDASSTATSSDFMIHLMTASTSDASSTEVAGSPQAGDPTGTTYWNLPLGKYLISETGDSTSSYVQRFNGDCDSIGAIWITGSSTKSCTLTNTLATSTATSTGATSTSQDMGSSTASTTEVNSF